MHVPLNFIQVTSCAVLNLDNAYKVPNVSIRGSVCKTNLPTNTGFRGFGTPEGSMIIEQIISRVAMHLGLPPEDVRELNFYKDGDTTPYGQLLTPCNLGRCWAQVKETSSFNDRKSAVEKFNRLFIVSMAT